MQISEVKQWDKYDKDRMDNQNKTIMELQNEIKEYQKRERAFLIHLHLKDKQLQLVKKEIKEISKKQSDIIFENKNEIGLDSLLFNELKTIKNLIKDKEEKIKQKDEELTTLQTIQNNPHFKKLVSKCRELNKENTELYNYTQGGTLENLKYENGLEKSQIDQLMLKLKEKEIINHELENEIADLNENLAYLNKRHKVYFLLFLGIRG
jgi:DNA repair exonuclease SbcCD ATPase subunit